MKTLTMHIPEPLAGKVIGKGGKTIKDIRIKSGAFQIDVGREIVDGQKIVTIMGPTESSCELARRAIASIIDEEKEGKSSRFRREGQAKIRSKRNDKAKGNYEPKLCLLCGSEINGISACIAHLGGKNHVSNVGGICLCGNCHVQEDSGLEAMLSCPAQQDKHTSLGFKVDEILAALAEGTGKPREDGAREGASQISPDPQWLVEISRRYVGWDGHKPQGSSVLPLSRAAIIKDSIPRLRLDELPPEFNAPSFPILMPVAKKIKRKKLAWPHSPDLSLPLAVLKVEGEPLADIDIVASTSLMHAMRGDSQYMGETFLVQRVGDSIAIQHQRKKSHSSLDIGVLVEDLCCPSKPNSSSFSLAKFQVGHHKLLLASEVDAYDPSTGKSVELKTRKKTSNFPKLKDIMQTSINGSSQIALVKPSKDEKYLESMNIYSLEETRGRKIDEWIYIGQRVKYVLPLVLQDPMVQRAVDRPVVMAFDHDKLPKFSVAPLGSSIVPADYFD